MIHGLLMWCLSKQARFYYSIDGVNIVEMLILNERMGVTMNISKWWTMTKAPISLLNEPYLILKLKSSPRIIKDPLVA